MGHNWTEAQSNAINTRNRDILVSAAAGSGKTAALTERIIRAVTREQDPIDITRILAVTFTRASAAELRRRISSALSARLSEQPSNSRLLRQLMLLGSAKICTIDSFCSDVVKSNFQRLDLPPTFRIPDDAELKLLRRTVMEEVIDKRYADGNMRFAALADCLTDNKTDTNIAPLLIKINQKLLGLADGEGYLNRAAERLRREAEGDFFDGRAGSYICGKFIEQFEYYVEFLSSACDFLSGDEKLQRSYFPAFSADLAYCRNMLSALRLKKYGEAKRAAEGYTALPLKSAGSSKSEYTDLLKTGRSNIKEALAELGGKYFALTEEEIRGYSIQTADMLEELGDTLSQYTERLTAEKQERSICDFDDIRLSAVKLLISPDGTPTDIARSYAECFDEVYIDEYQDVTSVQDAIFRVVSNGHNRFMVGDIKQSIYGFRGADPSLFAGYRAQFTPFAKFSPEKEEENSPTPVTVFMSENFRCDKNVVDFVNLVCPAAFRACGSSIGYLPEDDLVFSKKVPENYGGVAVNVTVITSPDKDKAADDPAIAESDKTEIDYIVYEISRLLCGERLSDGKQITPGDISVICRDKKTCADISEALTAANIPNISDSARSFFTRPEVILVINLLTVVDNPQKDIPLAATLRSPIFAFSMDELARIRARSGEKKMSLYDSITAFAEGGGELSQKCRRFISKLGDYRAMARSLPADRLIRGIYRDTALLSLSPDADSGRTSLLRIYEYARQFESGSFKGLYNFIRYINNAASDAEDETIETEPGTDAVMISTIHHSKGLEFPVCFICRCDKRFNKSDLSKPLIFDTLTGPAVHIKDKTGLAKLTTPYRRAAALHCERTLIEEEMRLLYVAMTRARERLYLTAQYFGNFDNILNEAELVRQMPSNYLILSASKYLDWILPAVIGDNSDTYKFNITERHLIPEPLPYRPDSGDREQDAQGASDIRVIEEKLKERFSFVYPYSHLTELPSKLSVSRLYPGMLDPEEESLTAAEADASDDLPLLSKQELPRPKFLSDEPRRSITSAEKGTATHVFLQFCDFDRCVSDGISAELARLVERRFMTPTMADAVNILQIERFFESDFFASLRSARRIWREQRFNILLPASSFTELPESAQKLEGEQILVQGVMDIFFEDNDGNIILCDYKTDRLTRDELENPALAAEKLTGRHGTQLSYYAEALTRMLGKRPAKVLIYSLPLGDTVDIKTD